MATQTQRRTQRRTGRVIDMRAASQSAFAVANDQAHFPELTPKRVVPVSSSDSTPRVRLVKDICRVGVWHPSGHEPWNVTPRILRDMAANFTQMIRNGNRINLAWGHGDPGQIGVDARNIIAPVDQVFVHGDTLYASSYVVPGSIDLGHQVSIRALENHRDGRGRVYPGFTPLHVAIVDHPIIDGQGEFRDMAAKPPSTGAFDMATDTTDETDTETEEGGADLADKLRELFSYYPPLALPDDVTDADLGPAIDTLIAVASAAEGGGEDDDDQGNGDASGTIQGDGTVAAPGVTDPNTGMPADMAAKLKKSGIDLAAVFAPLAAKLDKLETAVSALSSEKAQKKKDTFEQRVVELCANGTIPAAKKADAIKLGANHNYDLAILELIPLGKAVDMSHRSRVGASAAAPSTGAPKEKTDAEAKEAAKLLGAKYKDDK